MFYVSHLSPLIIFNYKRRSSQSIWKYKSKKDRDKELETIKKFIKAQNISTIVTL